MAESKLRGFSMNFAADVLKLSNRKMQIENFFKKFVALFLFASYKGM